MTALVLLAIASYIVYDWRQILHMFHSLINWVKLDPLKAGMVIFIVYVFLIIFSMPIVFFSVPLGYAFHQAFDGRFGKFLVFIMIY